MKIFIDTANLDEIKEANSWGIIDGVTTNPSLIKKAIEELKRKGENFNMYSYILEIFKTVSCEEKKPVSLEVISSDHDGMKREAGVLYSFFGNYNIVVKIPINTSLPGEDNNDALKTIRKLNSSGMNVNCTLIMTPEQALLAAKAGAKYVSPFSGRIDDSLRKKQKKDFKKEDYFDAEQRKIDDNGIYSGVELIRKTRKILDNYGFKTQIIASSIRNARQAREVAEAGTDIATLPFYVIKEMTRHSLTQEGMKKFLDDVVAEYRDLFEKDDYG